MARRRKRRLPATTGGLVVLDSGAITKIANERDCVARAMWETLATDGWRSCIPAVTLVEITTGRPREDAAINLIARQAGSSVDCDDRLARAAGALRFACRRTATLSVTDSIVAAVADANQPSIVLTTDPNDISALLTRAQQAMVVGV